MREVEGPPFGAAWCCCVLLRFYWTAEVKVTWFKDGKDHALFGTDMIVRLDGYGMPLDLFNRYTPIGVRPPPPPAPRPKAKPKVRRGMEPDSDSD